MEGYDFATATQRAYSWWQYEVCDVFIELMKPVMQADEAAAAADPAGPYGAAAKAATRAALCAALDAGLRLLHPFMPFVTEELWQRLPKTAEQVCCGCVRWSWWLWAVAVGGSRQRQRSHCSPG
jgi:valyl-tRNA synthetase